jgi:transcriptional activator-regulator prtR/CI repressor
MDTIGTRIRRLREAKNLTQGDLAKAAGVSIAAVSKWEKNASEPKGKSLASLSASLGIPMEYLVDGIREGGESSANDAAPSTPLRREDLIPAQQIVQILPSGVHPTDTHQRIEIYDVRLAAGPEGKGSTVEWIVRPEDDPLYFRHGWFKARRLTAGNLRAMYVRGDSMEPYLYNHDTIIIDTTDTELSDGEVYAITYNGHMLVKELRATPDGVRIISRNPAYDPIEYQGGEGAPDFQILGRVVWRGG